MGTAVLDGAPVGVFHDDAIYVTLGRALATGHGFRYLNLPGTPAAIHYPPGYPALLAMLWTVAPEFPSNLVLFKSVNLLLLAVAAVLAARLTRARVHSERAAIVVGVLAAVSVPLLTLGSMVLSEPLFLVMLLALLAAAEHLCEARVRHPGRADGSGKASIDALTVRASASPAFLLGAGIGALALVRSHGVVLAPACVLVLALRRRWRDAAILAVGTAVVLIPWQLWCAAHANDLPLALRGVYGSYSGWLAAGVRAAGPTFLLETVQRTTTDLALTMAALCSPSRSHVGHGVTYVALAVLAGLGTVALWRKAPVMLLFCSAYLAITIMWPFPPARFAWAIWPLVLMLLVAGALGARRDHAMRGTAERIVHGTALAAAAWLAVGYALYEVRAVRGAWWGSVSRSERRRIEPTIAWTLAHTRPSDVIASEDDAALFLYTGRQAVPVLAASPLRYLHPVAPADDARDGLAPIIDRYHPNVVVVGSDGPLAVATLLTGPPVPRLQPLRPFPGGAAFTVIAP